MKIQRKIKVRLTNYETFEPYPGSEDFQAEFKGYAINKLTYSFENESDFNRAVSRLTALNLEHQFFYAIALESDLEIENYPAIFLIFNSDPDLTREDNTGIKVDAKKMKGKLMLEDSSTGELVLHEKMKNFFDSQLHTLSFEAIAGTKHESGFYRIKNMHELIHAEIMVGAKGVCESENGAWYPVSSDDRVKLSDRALLEIEANQFVKTRSFEYKREIYKSVGQSFIASGSLALKIKKYCEQEKEHISLFIPTQDYV